MRTNPAYAALAHKKAIVSHVTNLLKAEYTTAFGDPEPQKRIICEEVFREDAEVPEDELFDFIAELELQAESLRLELCKFEFVKKDEYEKEPQGPARPSSPRQEKSPRGKKGGRRKR